MEPNSSQYEELYRAAVGEGKAGYYLPRFQRFDQPGANLVSWNWPAFFVSFFWMLYRRMYGIALGYLFLWPIAVGILIGVISLLFGQLVAVLAYWAVVLGQLIVVPMFANALYHWHVRSRIKRMAADAPSHEALVQRLIGQSSGGAPVVVAVACVVAIAFVGMLAAIAIPAYQDYTIRAQVSEGLVLAAPVKASVARAYATSSNWPTDLQGAGLEGAPDGKYVSGIEVTDGTILIRYGNAANSKISGHTLSLQPAVADDGSIEWICGYAAGDDATATDIAPKYLPRLCRDGTGQVERL